MTNHKDCYDTMFPDVLPRNLTGEHSGKVFSYCIKNIGLSRGQRSVDVDIASWGLWQQCPEFESCYKLSMGKLTLQSVIRNA